MPLKVQCPSCEGQYRVPDAAAGKSVRCKKCRAVIPVPAAGDIDYNDLAALAHGTELAREPAVVAAPPPRAVAAPNAPRTSDGPHWIFKVLGPNGPGFWIFAVSAALLAGSLLLAMVSGSATLCLVAVVALLGLGLIATAALQHAYLLGQREAFWKLFLIPLYWPIVLIVHAIREWPLFAPGMFNTARGIILIVLSIPIMIPAARWNKEEQAIAEKRYEQEQDRRRAERYQAARAEEARLRQEAQQRAMADASTSMPPQQEPPRQEIPKITGPHIPPPDHSRPKEPAGDVTVGTVKFTIPAGFARILDTPKQSTWEGPRLQRIDLYFVNNVEADGGFPAVQEMHMPPPQGKVRVPLMPDERSSRQTVDGRKYIRVESTRDTESTITYHMLMGDTVASIQVRARRTDVNDLTAMEEVAKTLRPR